MLTQRAAYFVAAARNYKRIRRAYFQGFSLALRVRFEMGAQK
jgi:hypothetical protein